jgi:DNA-binding HxlR family transcriptional regulator
MVTMMELQDHLDKWDMKCCPIDNSLKIFGQKFALHIIRNILVLKQTKFSQFLRSIEGINTKTLSIRLKELEDFGVIQRNVTKTRPPEVEYTLTEKGKALEPILTKIGEYSMMFEAKMIFKDKKPKTVRQVFGSEILSEIYD